jgi:hypothetical protein
MKRKIIFTTSIVLALFIAFTSAVKDFSGKFHTAGVPIPGETTCSTSGCHGAGNGSYTSGGLADNAGPGSIVLSSSNLPGWVYTPNTTYHMTITLTDPNALIFGFSASAIDNGGRNAGTIIVTDANHTRSGTPIGSSIVYITHVGSATGPNPNYQTITTNPAVINFDWTSPASNVGPVTFYFDGTACNNNDLEDSGDNVYSGSQVIAANSALSLLLVSPTTIPAFSSVNNVASLPQTVTVGGGNLTGSVTVNMPASYQVSLTANSGFTSSLILTPVSGNLATTILYVRFLPTAGNASGNITLSDAGSTTATIAVSGTTTAAPTVYYSSLISNSYRAVIGTPSVVKSFDVAGVNLTTNLVVTAIANFEVSLSAGSGFGGSVSIAPTTGTVASTTIYIRFNPTTAGTYNGLVPVSSTGATTKNVTIGGVSTVAPVITPTGAISAYNTTVGTPSAPQNFSVSGSSLKDNLVVTAPANFEVSLSSGSGYGGNIKLAPAAGSVASTIIYVRYNPFSAGTQSGNIIMSSIGSPTTATLALSGTSANPAGPAITVTNSLTTFVTSVGTPSAVQSSSVSGFNLTANILVTAPTDFEVSLSSGSGFGSSVNLIPAAGTVASTLIYIRYNPSASGVTSSSVAVTSTGASAQAIAVSGNSAATAVVNVSEANTKFSIYPNPTSGVGYIALELSDANFVKINLLNYQGQTVRELYSNSIGSGEVKIPFDLTGLNKGVYLIELQSGDIRTRKQVIAE